MTSGSGGTDHPALGVKVISFPVFLLNVAVAIVILIEIVVQARSGLSPMYKGIHA